MSKMSRYLSPSQAKVSSNGVNSVRARVVNLRELCPGLTVATMAAVMNKAFEIVYDLTSVPLHEEDFDQSILDKFQAEFSSYDWIYGHNLAFDFSCGDKFSWGEVNLQLRVEEGMCHDISVYTGSMDADLASIVECALKGCTFSADALCCAVNATEISDKIRTDICALIRSQNL